MRNRKITKKIASIIFASLFAFSGFANSAFALPAFPGAEGMGASTAGGRGGTVYKVTNLNDSGAGSFRDAVSTGNRIIVFTVSGVIWLNSPIQIGASNLTIAGQTSPGGICIAGYHVEFGYANHGVHDIIVSHMRFRTGPLYESAPDPGYTSISVNGGSSLGAQAGGNSGTDPTYNIIFDHCSFSWANDTNININYDVYNVTFSWCYITDPLAYAGQGESDFHNLGLLVWGRYNSVLSSGGVTIHHTYFGDCYYRVPEANYNAFADLTNNVIYHANVQQSPGLQPGDTSKRPYMNLVGNYLDVRHTDSYDTALSAIITPSGFSAYQALYQSGCYQSARGAISAWDIGNYDSSWGQNLISEDWKLSSPRSVGAGNTVTATTMNPTYAATVVAGAGATKPVRDSVDTAANTKFTENSGAYTPASALNGAEDWPTFSDPAAPADTDGDGMSDDWEDSKSGLNKNVNDSAGYTLDEDYTNIEVYLHELGGYVEVPEDETAPATPSGLSVS